MRPRLALVASILVLAFAVPAAAVESGSLRGVVLDTSGQPVAGATVSLEGGAPGVGVRAAVTDGAGRFELGSLPPAIGYRLRVVLSGFASVEMTGVQVEAGRVTQVTVGLSSSESLRETVTVRSTARVLDPDTPAASTRFSSEFIDAVPLLGRNYQDVLTLARSEEHTSELQSLRHLVCRL